MILRVCACFAIIASAFLTGCQSSSTGASSSAPTTTVSPPAPAPAVPVTYAGGDGSTLEKAVIVQTNSNMEGVRAEYAWLSQHYPYSKDISQTLLHKNGKSYDLLKIRTSNGQEVDIYFDISAFFGKY